VAKRSECGGQWCGEGRRRDGLTGGGAEARPDSEAAHGQHGHGSFEHGAGRNDAFMARA
jgi:hypothetical protein